MQENLEFFTVNKSVTVDGSLLSPTGGVKGMYPAPHIHEHLRYINGYGKLRYPAPDIHEHFTIHKWLRQTAYIFTHNFNNLEHIANNCMSAMTHTDATTAHH